MDCNRADLIYAAASVNRHPNCLDCLGDCLVFARSNYVAIYDKLQGRIVKFFQGHKDEVSSVQFIRTIDESQNLFQLTPNANQQDKTSVRPSWILSTSYDKMSIIWRASDTRDHSHPFEIAHRLEGHESAVLAGHSLQIDGTAGQYLLSATSDIDNVTKLWLDGTLVDTLKTNYMAISVRLATFSSPSTSVQDDLKILCLGGSDDNIHVYCITPQDDKLLHLIDISGHADWIRSLDIVRPNCLQPIIMLASASQDRFVRVWRLSLTHSGQSSIRKKITPVPNGCLTNNDRPLFLSVVLETVLAGHEGRVYDIKWSRVLHEDKVHLLSCSGDKSIMIWQSTLTLAPMAGLETDDTNNLESNITDDIWQEISRVGEAGECNLGFFGACLSRDSSTIYAYSLNGALHSWVSHSSDNKEGGAPTLIKWNPEQTIGGHFGPVTDLVWHKQGHYFVTSSLDKTCRIHAHVENLRRWNEISRPQVHGYEINCLTLIGSLRLASGADEKTIRLFEATNFFVKTFERMTDINLLQTCQDSEAPQKPLAAHAQVPALGLSNRAVSTEDTQAVIGGDHDERDPINFPDQFDSVPVEEILLQGTLWPEIQKLYGHSYEVYSVASDGQHRYLASASKANKSEFASIIIWDLHSFEKVANLAHHTLTVTRLSYSPDNKYLLSVSRDRTWCLWQNDPIAGFNKVASTVKQNTKHDRIIWDCSWTPDSTHFVTVSRDRKAIAWNLQVVKEQQSSGGWQAIILDDSIQAVDIEQTIVQLDTHKRFLVALGLESGAVVLCHLSVQHGATSATEWSTCFTITNCHQSAIRRLAFQPGTKKDDDKQPRRAVLASIAEDCVVMLNSLSC